MVSGIHGETSVIDHYYKGKRVLVVGGSGFIGSHLVEMLLASGARVFVPHRGDSVPWRLRELSDDFETISNFDIGDKGKVETAFAVATPDVVFNLAAYGVHPTEQCPVTAVNTNVTGCTNMAELCLLYSATRFIHVGTGFEYGLVAHPVREDYPLRPVTLYAATKAAGWVLLDYYWRSGALPLVTVRFFGLYGPRERETRLVPHVILSALDAVTVTLRKGGSVWDYLFVKDAVRALMLVGSTPQIEGETFNIGSGRVVTISEIARTVLDVLDVSVPIKGDTNPCLRVESDVFRPDLSRARERLGWQPMYTLTEGVKETVDWFKSRRYCGC